MDLREIEELSRLIAPYFNRRIRYGKDILPPPIIVEFLGTPDSGKTTLKEECDKFFKSLGFRNFPPQEGAEAVRYIKRSTPFYNVATGLYAFNILMNVSEGHQYDFVFFDRCVFDTYTWMKYWFKIGKLSQETMIMLQGAFLAGAPRVDLALMMLCNPEVAVARNNKNETLSRPGSWTNVEKISFLAECNRESHEELKDRFSQLVIMDTTDMDEKTMVHKGLEMIMNVVRKKIIAPAS